ncbi:amiloride-sensitive sodium channel subunit gamma-like [Acipenser ruthenus]|uniref:amiloride-sensitive sodium channel subunit gamma-like n=1 Tax=Acipenser ruthenus TaxID=7906 RepID=UPI0027422740|nr:amiloride-sensitive sodium channel subunit gamma-like [Acipenser ruthenus]
MLLKRSPAEWTLLRLCGELLKHTSAHGIPNVFRAAHWCRRLLWAVFVGFALCCALWQCTEMVLNYYRYPSHEKITLVSNTMLAFPAVTICNLNSVRYSSVRKSVTMTKSLQDLGLKQSHRRNKSSCWNTTCPDSPAESDSYPRALRKFASQFNQLSDEEKIAMGHQLEDMLIFCNFHGQMCDTSFFSGFVNYKFGNCYTFNSQKTTDIRGAPISGAALNTTRAGFVYGLHLELFIQQIEYVKDVTHSAGIRLLVHNHAASPFPEDEGVNIPPGTETDIGMMKVLIKRLKSPYGSHCTDGDGIKNFYHDVYGSRYTRESCKRTCAQLSIVENCGCSHWEFAAPPDLQYPKCNLSAVGVSECVELYGYKFAHGMLPCDCPLQCKEELYQLTVSGSQWPSSAFIEKFSSDLREMGGQLSTIADSPQLIRDNLVKVVVYYQQLNSEQIEEEPSVSEIDLISSMGGLVGLWVGFSVCTLVEFFELFVDMLVFFAQRCLWKAVPNTYANPCSERGRASFTGHKTTNM